MYLINSNPQSVFSCTLNLSGSDYYHSDTPSVCVTTEMVPLPTNRLVRLTFGWKRSLLPWILFSSHIQSSFSSFCPLHTSLWPVVSPFILSPFSCLLSLRECRVWRVSAAQSSNEAEIMLVIIERTKNIHFT